MGSSHMIQASLVNVSFSAKISGIRDQSSRESDRLV